MQLTFQSGLVIENPSEADIRDRLPPEIYTILDADRDSYLQCHVKFPWPAFGSHEFKAMPRPRGRLRKYAILPAWSRASPNQGYILEYQDGSLSKHYRAVDSPIVLEQVIDAFSKYLRGDESWRSDFTWEKMEL